METLYPALRHLHLSLAALSISGFLLRAVWALSGSPLLQRKVVRVLPHIVDTIFLASGIALTMVVHQYPFVHAWLTAKVIGLVVYIGLGMLTLKVARTTGHRVLALALALLTFGWIVSVALSRQPQGFFA